MEHAIKFALCAIIICNCVNFAVGTSAIWDQVSATIDAYSALPNCYVVVADSTGIRYQHGKGNATWTTYYPVASASKWVCSLTTFKLIEAGYFNLSSRPQDFISWWTKNSSDARTQITISQLLSFTSGFGSDNDCVGDSAYTLEQCAMKIYNESFQFTPGNVYYYGGNHMTVLGYMITQAMGADWNSVFNTWVLQPLSIPAAYCKYFPLTNPNPAGGLTTNVQYYYSILRALYLENFLPSNWTALMEQDQTTNTTMLYSPATLWGEGWHYCRGNWFECNTSSWSNACYQMNTHSSPGKFGFYPWIDRPNDYFGIVGTRDANGYTSVQLGDQIKPLILQALAEDRTTSSPTPSSQAPSPSTSPASSLDPTPSASSGIQASHSPSPDPTDDSAGGVLKASLMTLGALIALM